MLKYYKDNIITQIYPKGYKMKRNKVIVGRYIKRMRMIRV